MLTSSKIIYFSFSILIFALATAFKFAIILGGINLFLVSITFFILVYNWKFLLSFSYTQFALYLLPFILLAPIFINYSTFKISSYFYGLMFLSIFQLILNFLNGGYITSVHYKIILLVILKSYFFVALIQTILFPFGIYFNQIWRDETNRINSLATEPSYAGIIVVVTLYSYLLMDKNDYSKKFSIRSNLKYLAYGAFVVAVSQSGFAAVFFILLLFSFFKIWKKYFIPLIIFLSIILASVYQGIDLIALDRIERIFLAIGSLDIIELVNADHSGSIRIAPVLIFFQELNLTDINIWIGHGIGYSQNLLSQIIPGIDSEEWAGAAFLPGFIYDNGIISIIIFGLFILKNAVYKVISFESIFLLLTFLNSSFNSQLFWFLIIVLTINKFLIKHTYLPPPVESFPEFSPLGTNSPTFKINSK